MWTPSTTRSSRGPALVSPRTHRPSRRRAGRAVPVRLRRQRRHDDRQRHPPHAGRRPRRDHPRPAVDRRQLPARVRRAGPRRRQPVGPAGTARRARRRSGRLRPRQRRRRLHLVARAAHRRPRRHRHRGSTGLPDDAVDPHAGLPRARRTRQGDRPVGSLDRARRRVRTHHRRGAPGAVLVGQHLPGQAADRAPRRRTRAGARPGEPGPVCSAPGPARPGPERRSPGGPRLHDHRGAPARLGCRGHRARLRRCRRPSRGVRPARADGRRADARPRAVPRPPLHRSSAGDHGGVLRAVRLHLPHHAVLPVPARLQPARDRPAHPARRGLRRPRLGPGDPAGRPARQQGRRHSGAAVAVLRLRLDLDGQRRHRLRRDRRADGLPRARAWD